MQSGKYVEARGKLERLCEENRLVLDLACDAYPVRMTVSADDQSAGQLSFDEEDTVRRGSLCLVFDGEMSYRITDRWELPEWLMQKICRQAKALYTAVLEDFFREEMLRRGTYGEM